MGIERRRHTVSIAGLPAVSGFGHSGPTNKVILTPHIHTGELEIVYLRSGDFHWWAGESAYHLRGGDVYVTAPDLPHGSVRENLEAGEIFWFTIGLPKRGFLRGLDGSGLLAAGLRRLSRCQFTAGPLFPLLLDRLFPLLEEGQAGNREAGDEAGSWLEATLWEIVNRSRSGHTDNRRISLPLTRAMRAMEAHLDNSLTLQDLADLADLSLSHFKARFRQEVGLSPGRYYLRCRVTAAARAVAAGELPLLEIACDYGFSSTQYLTTCMRRELGKTPTQIRQEPQEL